jgi:hypothetical protein
MMNVAVTGVLINSALYLSGCFAAGLVMNNPIAWKAALLTAGIAYIGYTFGQIEMERARMGFAIFSIITGLIAGVSLLFA